MKSKKTLVCGFPRSGNTWMRFVIFNYWNIRENKASKTLTYRELIDLNERIWKKDDSLPPIYFSHIPFNGKMPLGTMSYDKPKRQIFDQIEELIYVLRNPFDCLISFHDYLKNRIDPFYNYSEKDRNKLSNLLYFMQKYLPFWINHVKSTLPLATCSTPYETLWKDPSIHFKYVLMNVFGELDYKIYKKALDLSSFESIKMMGITTKQRNGLASSYKGDFARQGYPYQYKQILSQNTIKCVTKACKKEGILLLDEGVCLKQ